MDCYVEKKSPIQFDRQQNILTIQLYIQPKASRDQIVGLHNNEIKVAITAPPIDGRANQHLIKFLAKQFKVAKSLIMVEKGELGRHKQIKIINPTLIPDPLLSLINQEAID
ncbi:DUF167 family protein YggU [Candidatus Schmidhempelia bombi]|jgi:uncharacterized protein|uniref:UPF0235 protein O970_04750 n=1 Tax=Candidatus Schmidhempelia bombi str. Bimp TaxID=1387197 RepID=A0AB94ICU1_9GAMM|nr:DUF167 family protein YggU [Candidatus Schmidhempelia bombi]TEA27241.1 YggU family protein [Candidatus Schmidhempelia bombi str. Bimp]